MRISPKIRAKRQRWKNKRVKIRKLDQFGRSNIQITGEQRRKLSKK